MNELDNKSKWGFLAKRILGIAFIHQSTKNKQINKQTD